MAWTSLVRNGTALQLRRGVRDDSGLAYGRFEERQNETGWNFLWLRTSGLYTDEEQMHAAGYLEGALTARLIPQHYSNWYSRAFKDELEPGDPAGGGVSAHLESLLFGQLEWARKRARRALARRGAAEADDAYWQLVGLNIAQLDGLLEGYNAAAEREHRFTALPLLLLNAGSEVRTLARALSEDGGVAGSLSAQLRGSAALRRIGNELHIAHASWQPYAHMLRVWKCVRTALKHPNVAAQGLAFPSHPGLLWSHDALAYASSGLVALSTAVPLAARASADDVRARGALPGLMRALVATRSARSGDEWCRRFARYNNGALPRQWLLLDLKRWWAPRPRGPPPPTRAPAPSRRGCSGCSSRCLARARGPTRVRCSRGARWSSRTTSRSSARSAQSRAPSRRAHRRRSAWRRASRGGRGDDLGRRDEGRLPPRERKAAARADRRRRRPR